MNKRLFGIDEKTGRRAVLRVCERLCLTLAITALGIYGGSWAHSRVYQAYDSWSFNQALKGEPTSLKGFLAHVAHRLAGREGPARSNAKDQTVLKQEWIEELPDQRDWSSARVRAYEKSLSSGKGQLIGRLEIPSIDLSVMVLEGTDELTLNRAVGHIEGTAMPGERGNLAIAGHRDGFFRGLKDISRDDSITLTTLRGTYLYRVDTIGIVKPSDREVLQDYGHPTMTLVTCYPFYFVGEAPKRLVVKARLDAPAATALVSIPARPTLQTASAALPMIAKATVGPSPTSNTAINTPSKRRVAIARSSAGKEMRKARPVNRPTTVTRRPLAKRLGGTLIKIVKSPISLFKSGNRRSTSQADSQKNR